VLRASTERDGRDEVEVDGGVRRLRIASLPSTSTFVVKVIVKDKDKVKSASVVWPGSEDAVRVRCSLFPFFFRLLVLVGTLPTRDPCG
jgi:hypothetical protein